MLAPHGAVLLYSMRLLLTATVTATAVRLGPTRCRGWTNGARGVLPIALRITPSTAARETFNPRVLGSNPSRLSTVSRVKSTP